MREKNELLIVHDNWKRDEQESKYELKHPFYTECYISGLWCIFQKAIEFKAWQQENKDRVIMDARSNVLSFIGKRGSGKTTAMDEFCRILRSMNKSDDYYSWWLKKVMEKEQQDFLASRSFCFHILEPIDASLFGDKEDLFEQVIVNIYKHFKEYLKGDHAEIMKICSEIMKMYYSTGKTSENRASDFSIANMMHFSSDNQTIQKKISELIDGLFLAKDEKSFEYLVIPIDDLDLNMQNAYQMMEQIQKYFSYYKIIVLVSMDYNQMRLVFEQHFSKKLNNLQKINGEKYYKETISSLTKDVMTKMFPLQQRMHMPDFERILKNTRVVVDENEKSMLVKDYLLSKTARYMYVYYDICGLKKHFAEKSTIREFVIYNRLLESLKYVDFSKCEMFLYKTKEEMLAREKIEAMPLDKKSEYETEMRKREENEKKNIALLERYDSNYNRILDDITQRMAPDELTSEQAAAFRCLSLRDLERRARYFVNSRREGSEIIFKDIDPTEKGNVSVLNQVLANKNLEMEYSYGMLLEQIYRWGRENENGYFQDKPYISCILASFTVEMTREYLHYCYNPDEGRRKEKYEKRLLGFIGKNIGSKWLGDAFPKFTTKNSSIVSRKNMNGYMVAVPNWLVINLNLEGITEYNPESQKTEKIKFKKWVEEHHYIEILEILNMLYSCVDGGEIKGLEFEFVKGDKDKERSSVVRPAAELDKENAKKVKKPHIGAKSNAPVKFDVMTFVLRSLNYKKAQEDIVENITKVLLQIKKEHWSEDTENETTIREYVKNSLKIKLEPANGEKWLKVAFPFYNLDMSYNICKRLRSKFRNAKTEESLLGAMKMFYGTIAELLEAEKKIYEENCSLLQKEDSSYGNAATNFDYWDNYINCPFIKYIRGIEKESVDEVKIMPEVEKAVLGMTPGNEPEAEEEDTLWELI